MKILMSDEFNELRKKIEKETGFSCYEPTRAEQIVFYGVTENFENFSDMVKDYIPSGTVAYLMDTKTNKMWDDFSQKWW